MSRKPISVVKPELLKCPNETVTALKLQLSSSSKDSILEDDLNCHSFIGKNDAMIQSSARFAIKKGTRDIGILRMRKLP